MKTLQLETKYLQIIPLKNGKPAGHPVFVKKGILKQIWEDYIRPVLVLIGGISILVQAGRWLIG